MYSQDFSLRLRNSIGIDGLISFVLGFMILFWPNKTAGIVTILTGIAFVLIGFFYLLWSFNKSSYETNWSRVSHLILATLYLVSGIFMFINTAASTKYLFIFVGISAGITWIVEGLIDIALLRETELTSTWLVVSSIISIAAGIALLFSPFFAARVLWFLLGLVLAISGLFKIINFFAWR